MYKSQAQRRYFHAAEDRGEIKPSVVHEFDEASKGKKMPEHVKKAYGGIVDCPQCGHHFYHGGEVEPDGDNDDFGLLGEEDEDGDMERRGGKAQREDFMSTFARRRGRF